jgi:hypothetical protein
MSEITFSHVKATIIAQVLCPDCMTELKAGIHDETPCMVCPGCKSAFRFPTIELERMPTEDYTHDALASEPTENRP